MKKIISKDSFEYLIGKKLMIKHPHPFDINFELNMSQLSSNGEKLPNIIFVIDTNIESLAVLEAKKSNIPIIGILDSNSDPDNIDFPIPGNDDARRSINLYCDLIKKTIIDAKKKIKVSEQEVKLTQSKTKVSDKKEASIKITNKKSKEEKK